MDLIERLRPRWRHPDPDVRVAAVREMGRDDHDRLATIAESDPEPRVRRAAVKRLDDAELLARLAERDPDHALRELAVERAREVLIAVAGSERPLAECEAALAHLADEQSLAAVAAAATHAEVRYAALDRIVGERMLRDVVRTAADPATREAALDRIQDVAVLKAIAVGDGTPELALQALERIDDAEVLQAIADHRAAAKSVRQRARAKLPGDAGERPQVGFKEGRARQLALCVQVDALVLETDAIRAAERVRDAEREWDALAREVAPRPDVAERFRTTCAVIRDDAASLARRRAEDDHTRTTVEAGLHARRGLCERVEALDGAHTERELARAREAWRRLPPIADGDPSVALLERFAQACTACEDRHGRWRAAETLRAELDALVEEAEAFAAASPPPAPKRWKALERRWAAVDFGGIETDVIPPLVERFAGARDRLEQRWREAEGERTRVQQENLERLEALCRRVQAMTTADGLRPHAARRELRAIELAAADPGALPPAERRAEWVERLSTLRDELLRRIRKEEETEEWRRWANVGAQEELILRVEGLLEASDLAEGVRQLGRLQDEWASVATASPDKSQALWERFRAARNELRRRCDAWLGENLVKKRALVVEVQGLGESTTWNETAEVVRRLQADWKAIGPVPGRYAKALWEEFRAPCDRFFAQRKEYFDRRDGERAEIATQKIALCEQAEALAESTDWEATATAMKQLQAEWKRTGPLPRVQSEALWQRFRAAGDRFFDRRSRREEIAQDDALRKVQALCEELEALVAAPGEAEAEAAAEVGRKVDETWVAWVRLDLPPRDAVRALGDRIRAACEAVATARPESLRGTRLDPEITARRREKLCSRLEELGGTGGEAPRTLSLQEMALALRDRLATNTIAGAKGGDVGRRQDVAQEVEKIDASWAHLGPALDEPGRALAARFAAARARVEVPAPRETRRR